MSDFVSALPQLAAIVEKAGIIGLLIIAAGVLAWYCLQLRKELLRVYAERDVARLKVERYRATCNEHDIEVDTADLDQMLIQSLTGKGGA